jgi:hypothetical protein
VRGRTALSGPILIRVLLKSAAVLTLRVLSSAGRASPLQGECRRFDPVSTHQESTSYATPGRATTPLGLVRSKSFSHETAVQKIAAAIGAPEHRTPATVQERVYNCHSARELISRGVSERPERRLFETGWSGDRVFAWVTEPLFLLDSPAELCRVWAGNHDCEATCSLPPRRGRECRCASTRRDPPALPGRQ